MGKEIAHKDFKVTSVHGRYVNHKHLKDYMSGLKDLFPVTLLGKSVLDNPIHSVSLGEGTTRILMWSQMHGNESTTTKAVLDMVNYLKLGLGASNDLLAHFTIKIIPILNPDGAMAYTRVNANGTDLNRDAKDLSQPESKLLRRVYEDFKPHYCFNLHDQRTIFNVGETDKPATVSFLAPAFDEGRNLSKSRTTSMQLIAAMNQKLQQWIPGQVGRYDDGFNANCVGDAFQMLETPTILFEAGHFPGDYQREATRQHICFSLLEALHAIANGTLHDFTVNDYLGIPENQKMFCDIRIENAHVLDSGLAVGAQVAVLFQEKLEDGHIVFVPTLDTHLLGSDSFFGHETKDAAIPADWQWLQKHGVLALF